MSVVQISVNSFFSRTLVCSICRVRRWRILNFMTPISRGGNFRVKIVKSMYHWQEISAEPLLLQWSLRPESLLSLKSSKKTAECNTKKSYEKEKLLFKRKRAHKTEIRLERWHIKKAEKLKTIYTRFLNRAVRSISYDNRQIYFLWVLSPRVWNV